MLPSWKSRCAHIPPRRPEGNPNADSGDEGDSLRSGFEGEIDANEGLQGALPGVASRYNETDEDPASSSDEDMERRQRSQGDHVRGLGLDSRAARTTGCYFF